MSYSAASAYHLMFAGATRPLGEKELWKVAAPPKVKYFFWLALHMLDGGKTSSPRFAAVSNLCPLRGGR